MKQETLDRAFAAIEEAAAKGERCPTNDQLPGNNPLGVLARDGRVRIEVFAQNWRVVTILDGPHKGKHTLQPKTNSPPYVVIDKGGRHGSRYGTHAQRQARLQREGRAPSAPRLLSKEDLR